MIQLDIATILFLYGTSLVAGMLALLHVQRLSSSSAGLKVLMLAFGLILLGSMLAAFGAKELMPFDLWPLASLVFVVAGFETLFIGLWELSGGRFRKRWVLIAAYPLAYVLLGVTTRFHEVDSLRALMLHGNGTAFLAASAWVVWRHNRTEPLPTRPLLAGVLATKAAVYGIGLFRLASSPYYVELIAYGFFFQIVGNFAVTLFVYGMTADRVERRLRLSAWIDGLTGAGNRQWFAAWVPERLGDTDVVIAIDLDHFKRINDHYGHVIGDAVLVATTRVFRDGIRDRDVLARYGGEEFVVYLSSIGREGGLAVAERLRRDVAALKVAGAPASLSITASMGLAVVGADGLSRADAYRKADLALYQAKKRGRNQCVVYEDADESQAPLLSGIVTAR